MKSTGEESLRRGKGKHKDPKEEEPGMSGDQQGQCD